MGSEKNDSKSFTFEWQPVDIFTSYCGFVISRDKLFISEDFKPPNDNNVRFQLRSRFYGIAPEIVEVFVLKMGSIYSHRADVTIKITNPKELKIYELKKTIDWNVEAEIFTFRIDECLSIHFQVTCIIKHHEYNDYKVNDENILFTSIKANHMKNYLFSPDLSDVVIKVKNEELPAHKIVLASHSLVFTMMFNTNMKESKENCICFEELDADIIKEMLRFMYTGDIEAKTDMDVLFTLFSYANMYQIDKLKIYSEYRLMLNLTNDNVIKIAVHADSFDIPKLKERIMDYLVFHKAEISYNEAIIQVQNSKILKKFFLNTSEMKEE